MSDFTKLGVEEQIDFEEQYNYAYLPALIYSLKQ